ncbi:MAG: PDZ domain-containing protein [Clostridia bacterium]|nr:PDZ domain-containing protein [Clostridia bacterium]
MDRYQFQNEPVQAKTRGPVRVSLGVLIICILLTALIVFTATFALYSVYCRSAVQAAYGRFSEFEKLTELAEIYDNTYLYDVDKDLLDENLTEAYIYGCGDKFSSYYTAEEWAKQEADASGASVGVGIYVTMTEAGEIQVVKVMQNSPASRGGLLEGDVIVSVDGKKVKEIGYEAATNLVRGEIGTSIAFEVLRLGETFSVTLTRDRYDAQTVFAETVLNGGKNLGYVKITEFLSVQTTSAQFEAAVDGLIANGAQGLIFDLRDNGGGDLSAILKILDYLLPEGPLVHIYTAGAEKPTTYYSGKGEIALPMTVLTNEHTASAAELFTAALRDYGKAETVGVKTYGKGCGQTGSVLSDGSVVFITNFLYNPPYSENYDGVGIYPDHEVTLDEKWKDKNLFLLPHAEDTQLYKAVDVLTGILLGN